MENQVTYGEWMQVYNDNLKKLSKVASPLYRVSYFYEQIKEILDILKKANPPEPIEENGKYIENFVNEVIKTNNTRIPGEYHLPSICLIVTRWSF
ncbi:hypothetical protein KC901_02815 [Patescibacteria group bacterium]|nr:hypothetical protein [Patescibacteria group bacterium]